MTVVAVVCTAAIVWFVVAVIAAAISLCWGNLLSVAVRDGVVIATTWVVVLAVIAVAVVGVVAVWAVAS